MKSHPHTRSHHPCLLAPFLLLWACLTPPGGADFPPQNSYYPLVGDVVTECKYRTARSKHSWLMDLTLPYLLRDSVENKYRELFHNNTFIPYIMRTPFTIPVPTEEDQDTTTDVVVGKEHVDLVLRKKIQQALKKVQKNAKDKVYTKSYTLAEPFVSTHPNGEPLSIISEWYPDNRKSENFGQIEQKGAMYKPKIQPKIWLNNVNARGLWENKSLINGISDSFDPDYDVHDPDYPFPNGDINDGRAYESEIPMLKNRSMCPNIIFITLGPGEHPIHNPVYMDSDYNIRDIPNFNGTWTYPEKHRRTDSPESRVDPAEALAKAKYMNEVFNKTREHAKIMDEYPKDKWRNKDFILKRRKRELLNATIHEGDLEAENGTRLDDEEEDVRNVQEETNAKEARHLDEKRVRELIDEEIMARALYEKRQRDFGNVTGYRLKGNHPSLENNAKNVSNQEESGDAVNRKIPNHAEKNRLSHIETKTPNQGNTGDVNRERTHEDSEDYKNIDSKTFSYNHTEFDYDVESYKEMTPHYRNIARANYEDILTDDEFEMLKKEREKKHEEKTNLENEDSVISIHANLGRSMEEKKTKPQRQTIDFLSFVEPLTERQENGHCNENNETLSCNQSKSNCEEDLKPFADNLKTIAPHENQGTIKNEVINKFENGQTTERVLDDEATVNEKQDVTNNTVEKENKMEKDQNKEREENTIAKERKNIVEEQNNMANKQTTPYTFYESPELDSYREPDKDYETTENHETPAYEEYHHESMLTEPPPQKERLEPEDVRKVYKGPKKPQVDEDKVCEMFKMSQLLKDNKESCKQAHAPTTRDFLDVKEEILENNDENEGVLCRDNSKAKAKKFRDMMTEMRNKLNYLREGKGKQIEDEASKQQKDRKERIQILKDYYQSRFKYLRGDTGKKVQDYPTIQNTEELSGFPVNWYRKNKDKIRTRKEIELEDIEEDLDKERRDRLANAMRKKRDLPKSRKKRSTKIMIKKDNKTYVISTKHLNLFRRKNVKIYLNHEHVRRFDNRRRKRHVADKIEEGFDSENEKYIEDRTGDKKAINSASKYHDGDYPIYLDSQDLEIRHVDDKTEPIGTELKAEDIVNTNYIDPREIEQAERDTSTEDKHLRNTEDSNTKNNNDPSIDIKQIDNWVNIDTKEVETWLSTNQANASVDIESLNTPDIDSVDMHESELVAESGDEMKSRVKREADFVYVTRPKRGWKKYIKSKIRAIKLKMSTKFKDRIYEWTTRHKWETLPDEKDRTTPTLPKKRFLNIKKICQML